MRWQRARRLSVSPVWRVVAATVVLGVIAGAVYMTLFSSRLREPEVAGGPQTARLISSQQYINTIHDIFGDDIVVEVSFALPQRRQGLLSLGAVDVVMTPGLLDQYDRAARAAAVQILEERRRGIVVPCEPRAASAPDDACAEKFFAHVGRFLYRRPLTGSELKLYAATAHEVAKAFRNFYTGLTQGLAAMMVSPQFLYFIERVEPDPDHRGRFRLDAYSKATRLSLFLWDSVPDEALLAAAETGELHDKAGLRRQVERLMAAPERLDRGTRAFFADMLSLEKFDGLTKDTVIYPSFTQRVAASAGEQMLRLISDHLLTRQEDYRDLFTTDRSFVNPELAPLQGVVVDGAGWTPLSLGKRNAAGILTSVGFLAAYSHPGRSSPTLRGKAIREALLCQKVPNPPGDVDFQLFEQAQHSMKTARERLTAHAAQPACSGCHKIMDPLGLALENFDGSGQFRASENGAAIDASGTINGVAFAGGAGLGQALHSDPSLPQCLVSRLYAYGVGKESGIAERLWLDDLVKRFAGDGYRYPDLLRLITMSRAFYAVKSPEKPADRT